MGLLENADSSQLGNGNNNNNNNYQYNPPLVSSAVSFNSSLSSSSFLRHHQAPLFNFQNFKGQVEKEPFFENKKKVIQHFIDNALEFNFRLSCQECKTLLQKNFTFAAEKKEIILMIYPFISNLDQFQTVIAEFKLASDREEVKLAVSEMQSVINPKSKLNLNQFTSTSYLSPTTSSSSLEESIIASSSSVQFPNYSSEQKEKKSSDFETPFETIADLKQSTYVSYNLDHLHEKQQQVKNGYLIPKQANAQIFKQLLDTLYKCENNNLRLEMLQMELAEPKYFTSDQAAMIIASFISGMKQAEACIVLYNYVTDNENFHKVVARVNDLPEREYVKQQLHIF